MPSTGAAVADRIIINFGAETREVEVAGRKMSDVLKDTQDALEDVGEAGEDAGKQSTDALDDTAKAGEGVKDSLSAVGAAGSKALKGDVGGAAEEVATTLADIATAAIPGVGAALGVLATEGIQAITAGLQESEKQAQALKDQLSDAYQTAVEGGRRALDEAQIQSAAYDIIFSDQRDAYLKNAQAIGVDFTTYVRALVGDENALNQARETGIARLEQQKALTEGAVGANGEAVSAYDSQLTKIQSVVDLLNAQKASQDDIKESVELSLRLRNGDLELVQKTNKAIADTPATVPTRLTVDTSALDEMERTPRRVRVDLYDQYGRGLK